LGRDTKQIEDLPVNIDRETLQETLPPEAARTAVDCALFHVASKKRDQRMWETANIN